MTEVKRLAKETLEKLYFKYACIDYGDYQTIRKGLDGIEPLRDRDEMLEELWEKLGDVPMDPETECLEAPFLFFPVGTEKMELWRWFDERHSKGVVYLLYHDEIDSVKAKRLLRLDNLSFECKTTDCAYNQEGYCRYALVKEKSPTITEEEGCTSGVIEHF